MSGVVGEVPAVWMEALSDEDELFEQEARALLTVCDLALSDCRMGQRDRIAAAAANARSVVVGDISLGYTVRRVRGLGVQRQVDLHSDNGQFGYRAFERVDGRVVLADALRILANSAT